MTTENSTEGERLNKYLALRLGISRREADIYIDKGRVTINGQDARIGVRVLDEDRVEVDGNQLSDVSYTYLAFHKPVGYVSSRRAQGDAPTLYELLPQEFHHLKPVGRLDKNSSGLLLLTNDGDFAYNMTHPKFYKTKVYLVKLDHELEPLHQQMISDYGVQLEDGVSKFGLERLSETNREEWRVTMSEGRNRQIRRTFKTLGYTVMKLHRISFGDYALGDLKPAQRKTLNIS